MISNNRQPNVLRMKKFGKKCKLRQKRMAIHDPFIFLEKSLDKNGLLLSDMLTRLNL